MKRSNNESNKQQRKRSLDNPNSSKKFKKRRHTSPQHDNPSKKRSSSGLKNNSKSSRKSSSRRHSFSAEITLPNWERISPNIDQILSNKHTQSGVYAHEVHLVQQELEALLSMSIVRENLLLMPINNDNMRARIRQHQEAEHVYSAKNIPSKPLPPLVNHQQKNIGPHLLLDRQVSMTPIVDARIDKIWTEVNAYYHKVSASDLGTIENLLESNQQLEEKIRQYKIDYQNNLLTQLNIIDELNDENFHELSSINQVNPLITHYLDRTTIGRFQTKLYEHVPHSSPIYKTPISSPFYRKSLSNCLDHSSLRISPRLHLNHRINLFPSSNLKSNDDPQQSSLLKSNKKTRILSISPPSSTKLQERIQLVHDYLTDQHLSVPDRIKSQLPNRKRKSSITIHTDYSPDIFESKLSTLISLLHECSSLSLSALNRARLRTNHEQIWQKLNTIEHEFETLIQKIDMTGGDDNSINTEKIFQTLNHLLQDWEKYEVDIDRQLE